jgi:hypothetical protein
LRVEINPARSRRCFTGGFADFVVQHDGRSWLGCGGLVL